MVLYTIKVNGFEGQFRADVVPFNKYNKGTLIDIMYGLGIDVPLNPTLKQLKEAARQYGNNYPCGFKHIEGIYCYYQCLG